MVSCHPQDTNRFTKRNSKILVDKKEETINFKVSKDLIEEEVVVVAIVVDIKVAIMMRVMVDMLMKNHTEVEEEEEVEAPTEEEVEVK